MKFYITTPNQRLYVKPYMRLNKDVYFTIEGVTLDGKEVAGNRPLNEVFYTETGEPITKGFLDNFWRHELNRK